MVEWSTPQMTIWRIRIACRTPKATNAHTGCVLLVVFHSNNGCTKAPQCYAIRTLPGLLDLHFKCQSIHRSGCQPPSSIVCLVLNHPPAS